MQTPSIEPEGPGDPLVSIIMAAYNHERYVAEAIESLQAQTYEDWELIAVDDASPDATAAIISEFAESDPRITLLRNEENLGGCRSRKRALEHARGDIVAIQDSDDMSFPDRIETTVRAFTRYPELGAFSGLYTTMNSEGQDIDYRFSYRVPDSATAYRAALLDEIDGYDERFRFGYEVDLYLRLRAAGCRFGRANRPLVKVRVHPGQTTLGSAVERAAELLMAHARAAARERGEAFDLEAAMEQYRQDPDLLAKTAYDLGWRSLKQGDVAAARRSFGEALSHRPSYGTARLWSALCRLPPSIPRGLAAAWLTAKDLCPTIGSPLDDWWEVLDV